MREIKFRIWNKFLEKMSGTKPLCIDSELVQFYIEKPPHHDFVLMQFSGILDKNGKEIYEGDVLSEPIQIDEEWTNSAISVIWSDEKSAFCVDYSFEKDGSYLEYLSENCSEMEIIGNIYENPELLTSC